MKFLESLFLMCVFGKPARKPQRSDLSKGKPIKSNLYLYASCSKYKYMYLNASVSNKSKATVQTEF